MTLDPDLVIRKLALIAADLERLRPYAALASDDYLADERNELVVERLLERIIGRMIDVNYHVVTTAGGPPPRDYHASFLALVGPGALPDDLAKRLARSAGLRNRIAHMYDDLDPRMVHAALAGALQDIPEYMTRLTGYADSAGS